MSLFAELFHEMLQRDFGHTIYSVFEQAWNLGLYDQQAEKEKTKNKEGAEKKEKEKKEKKEKEKDDEKEKEKKENEEKEKEKDQAGDMQTINVKGDEPDAIDDSRKRPREETDQPDADGEQTATKKPKPDDLQPISIPSQTVSHLVIGIQDAYL